VERALKHDLASWKDPSEETGRQKRSSAPSLDSEHVAAYMLEQYGLQQDLSIFDVLRALAAPMAAPEEVSRTMARTGLRSEPVSWSCLTHSRDNVALCNDPTLLSTTKTTRSTTTSTEIGLNLAPVSGRRRKRGGGGPKGGTPGGGGGDNCGIYDGPGLKVVVLDITCLGVWTMTRTNEDIQVKTCAVYFQSTI
jgi:hypothetical protein